MYLNEYYTRVAEHAKTDFLDDNNVVGIVLAWPGPTKETFMKGQYLDYRLQKKIIAVVDTSYAGEEGIRHTLDKMVEMELFKQYRTLYEKQLVPKFMRYVGSERVVYGLVDVLHCIKNHKAETVIVTDKADIDTLEEEASREGIPLEIIAATTEHGIQFQTFGELGVILKF
jgi:peptide chain release factor subunit 1